MSPLTSSELERLRPSGLVYLVGALRTRQDVYRWCQALRQWQPPRAPLRVHMEHNSLDEHAAAEILEAVGGTVQAVYLHHNEIRDMEPLGTFIEKHSETLQELHLSHNRLYTAETKALLLQIGCTRLSSDATETTSSCSWLRLEFNYIDVAELMRNLPPPIRQRIQLDDCGCTPGRCYCKRRRYLKRIHCKLLAMQRAIPPEDRPQRHQLQSEAAARQGRLQLDHEPREDSGTAI
ncbi:mdh [Symbiodinium sp. CCMP2592]|nr:mdh [Symbiodinium sp. CCMP2592]